MMKPQPCLLALLVILGGCHWFEDRYLERAVADTELVGRWTITPTGVEGLIARGVDSARAAGHFIELRADHSCNIRALDEFRRYGDEIVQASCTWRLNKSGEHQEVVITSVTATAPGQWFFSLAEEEGRLLLWVYATDPDLWEFYEFAK